MWINDNEFLVKESEIPKIPIAFSEESKAWWREMRRRCIEGYSVGGKWMPPTLYFYINFWNIEISKLKSKQKILGRPWLRDVEWEVAYAWVAARGLSGFSNSGHISNINEEVYDFIKNSISCSGTPLYDNQAKDMMLMSARETGKSFQAAAIIGHEWLFNGEKAYIYPEDRPAGYRPKSHITVGAGDAKYSKKLLDKVKLGIDSLLRQSINFNNVIHPHPFFQTYSGSWQPGKEIIAEYKKKVGGQWTVNGSGSIVKHVTYKDNPFAGQGTRNSIMVKEEIGFFDNLIEAQEADVETMMAGTDKYGSCMYIGTGGDMGSGTLGSYKMFYDPDTYSMISFNDTWENKGKIALFIPATMRPNEFKDADGNTKYDIATTHFLKIREDLKKSKNGHNALNAHIQYNPLIPSEVFLRTNVNIFPVAELKDWLAELETNTIYKDAEFVGELVFNENGKIEPRLNNKLEAIREFPITRDMDMAGAVVIYHHPQEDTDGTIPWGRYIAGIDPYDANKSTTTSLGSCFIMDKMSNRVVAEYTGRPKFADMCWEITRRLLLYYNAIALYENEKPGIKQYFERKNSLNLLMRQPKYIKDVIPNSTVERQYGMHMNQQLKDHGEILLRDWLQTEQTDGTLQLRNIRCVPLLHELIMYDETGNYDRVMAMIQCMYALQELHKQKIIMAEENMNGIDPFFKKKIFLRNKL